MKTLRILIADDHDVVREGVRALLAPRNNWRICGEAVNGREAVAKAKQLKPHVVVLDLSMPELNGLDATRQIRKAQPQTEVAILTMHESETLAQEALAAGARAFVVKSNAKLQLIPAVEALARHEPFPTSAVSASVLDGLLHPEGRTANPRAGRDRLTSREREIVQLIAEGKTSKEVAATLGVSVRTVGTHRANLMSKLNLRSATQVVRYALREKIIQG
jgi:DNA-binding NarL/FixJ family response regulator